MNALVVFTHPNRKSLNGAFLDSTLSGLQNNPEIQNIEVLDLYGQGFDPLLRFGETKRRRDLHKDPAFEKYREQIREADLLIFIYPIWWGRPPAMLLGYFDQLFVTNFAYRYPKGKLLQEGLLKGKKAICIYTMKGPTGYPALAHRNAHKVLMKKALFQFVGLRKVRFFEFGGMEKGTEKQAARLRKIESYMTRMKPSGLLRQEPMTA